MTRNQTMNLMVDKAKREGQCWAYGGDQSYRLGVVAKRYPNGSYSLAYYTTDKDGVTKTITRKGALRIISRQGMPTLTQASNGE